MSNTLAIAAVTATLQRLLAVGATAGLPPGTPGGLSLSNTRVTAVPPDRARAHGEAVNQLNLHLLHVSPNAALRNRDQAAAALDLHYLITAYPAQDDELGAHILLGQAVKILLDHAHLGPDAVRGALPGADLEAQLEHVRLTPRTLTTEELARVWAMYQTPARPALLYTAAVVLIDAQARPSALPVLRVGRSVAPDLDPGLPRVDAVEPAELRAGQALRIRGRHLRGDDTTIRLVHPRLADPVELPVEPGPAPGLLTATLPADPARVPAGIHALTVVARRGEHERSSNAVALVVRPEIVTPLPHAVARDGAGAATISLEVRPHVLADQRVALVLGDREHPAAPRSSREAGVTVTIAAAAPGSYPARLRVDGVDSSLLVDPGASPPQFDPERRVVIT